MKSFKSLAIAVGSLCVLPAVAQGKEVNVSEIGMAMMRLNASPMTEGSSDNRNTAVATQKTKETTTKFAGGSIWNSLKNDFRLAEVNSSLIRSHENRFVANSAYFNRTIARSQPYMYHIVTEVKKRGMPAEIALLPFIESAYVTKARSHVGASGLWQFMPATGRHYGLEQTPLYDGRHDVYAATDAALNYLQYLHGLFGDWSLALAAYNWGEGNVSRAVRRAQAAGIAPTYENLKMPAETRNYVPKLLAVRNLVNNPNAFGLSLPDIQNKPYFKVVNVDTPLDIMAAAHLANISENEFLSLNPGFKTPVFIPKHGRKMLLPVAAANVFETNLRNADTKNLLSWDVYTPDSAISLNDLAMRTNTSVSELRRLNGILGSRVAAGRSVLVAKNNTNNTQGIKFNFAKVDQDHTPDTFVEQQPVLVNFVQQNKALDVPKIQADFTNKVVTTNAPSAPVATKLTWAKSAETAPVVEKKTPEINFIANSKPEIKPIETAQASTPSNLNSNNVNNVNLVDEIAEKAERIESPMLREEDPLLTLVGERERERERALQATRQTVAQANAAVARAERLAEARETKRRQQEQQRLAQLAAAQEKKLLQQKVAQAVQALPNQGQGTGIQSMVANQNNMMGGMNHKVSAAEQKLIRHTVIHGDTLFNIAQRYNINVSDLITSNNLRGNHIRLGQVLKVYIGGNKRVRQNPLQKVSLEPEILMPENTTPVSATKLPEFIVVRKGDTLTSIAARYHLDLNEVKRLNNDSEQVKIGQKLKLIAG